MPGKRPLKIHTLASDTILNVWLNNLGYDSLALSATYLPLKPLAKERPVDFAYRISFEKMKVLTTGAPTDSFLITTVKSVACGRRVLGIPETLEEARQMLSLLSGRRHQVLTVLSVKHQNILRQRLAMVRVSFKKLSQKEIENYLQTLAWCDHAGGYDALGKAAPFIKAINGSIGALWGVPTYELTALLGSL
jgi:septum formation protein